MKEIGKIKTDETDINLIVYGGLIEAGCKFRTCDVDISLTLNKEEAAALAKALIDAIVEVD